MASLNTLRTKFGALLSVIIALALLAFILSLKTDMGFSDNDPKVGVIDGDKIRYSEYLNQYDAIKNRNGGVEASTDQESDQLAAATWQALFADHVLVPGFERMGIEVPEQERLDMVSGKIPSQAFYSAFGDPRTGAYNAAAVSQFLTQAASDARAQQAWNDLNEQARLERAVHCFSASGISKERFYRTGRKSAALGFLLFIGYTGRFLYKGSDLRRRRRPCNIETMTDLIERAIKRLPFRVTLEILFCIHRKHLTSNRLYSILCSFSTKTKIP